MNTDKKTAIVAGGAGFIGSNLCRRLLHDGRHVVCIDNLSTGCFENVRSMIGDDFEFIRHDITEPLPFSLHADEIYNLACPASPTHYQKDAIHTTKTAVIGTINMLELARANGCPILQSSTSEVYGNPEVHPQTEDYCGYVNPVGIRSCYDEGKRCAESLCMDYHRQYGVNVKIVRIFNTYGPGMASDDGRVVSNFITQALSGLPITIYGDGSQTRSFMYIDDLIEALVRMTATPKDVTGPVNLGNPDERSVNELADMVIALTGSHSQLIHTPLPKDDPCRRCPDIAQAQRILIGWMPIIKMETGLQNTIKYYQKRQKAYESKCGER